MTELVIPRGITRYDYRRTLGWLARAYRTEVAADGGREQKTVRRLFSDGVYGGEEPALDAAVAWLAEQKQELVRERKRLPGYGYVQRTTRSYRSATGELVSYPAFEAWCWDVDGKPRSTSWSIDSHGAERAEERCNDWLDRVRSELGAPLEASEPLARAG